MKNCYTIAGVTFEAEVYSTRNRERMKGYLAVPGAVPEFSLAVTEEDLLREKELTPSECHVAEYEFTAIYRRLLPEYLMKHDTFFLHCSALAVDGQGCLFSAPSGTGKSTHRRLWQERYGAHVVPINDDKPLIRCGENTVEVFSTPWMGKEGIGTVMSAPVKALFFLTRSAENFIRPMEAGEALLRIFQQIVFPKEAEAQEKMLTLLDRFLSIVPAYELGVNMTPQAAETAYRAVFGSQ